MRKSLRQFSRATFPLYRPHKMLPKRPIRLVLDFDGTITLKDTLGQLSWAGYTSPNNTASKDTWSAVVDGYMADQKAHTENYTPPKDQRTTITQELTWLESLAKVEKQSFNRGLRSGIFESVTEQEIDDAARQLVHNGDIALREGWLDMIKAVSMQGTTSSNPQPVDILSVSWSIKWLRSCLNAAAEKQGAIQDINTLLKGRLHVHANEICDFGSPQELNDIQTSKDKVRTMVEKVLKSSTSRDGDHHERELLVYVGDSSTDLGCLLAADVGCSILDGSPSSGQKELQETLQRVGVAVDDLVNFTDQDALNLSPKLDSQKHHIDIHGLLRTALPAKIWRVKSFEEIRQWLSTWASSSTG